MKTFTQKWIKRVQEKQSILCAGLDPAPFEMGRGEKGLPFNVDLETWALDYIDAIADYSCALKYNTKYWTDETLLRKIIHHAKNQGLLVIEDSKIADIGETNQAGLLKTKARNADAVTIAPFAGNFSQTTKNAKEIGIAVFGMCLMSNPDYQKEKLQLVLWEKQKIPQTLLLSVIQLEGKSYLPRYLALANEIQETGAEGAVVGTTSHIQEHELEAVSRVLENDRLLLSPGFGAQGGGIEALTRYFDPKRIMLSASRDLMFPNGSLSTKTQQREKAKQIQNQIQNQIQGNH